MQHEINLKRVSENGLYLKEVKEQTEDICLESVRQNGVYLYFVKNQTGDICREALKSNASAIYFIDSKKIDEYIEKFNIRELKATDTNKGVIAVKENGEWLFSLDCQKNISKDEFIDMIYNMDNVNKQIYTDFIENLG
ncbi:hypothetical protein NBN67_19595 [Clostridioides difficile]|uniref:hypothetical protein n=1 Tax=Clostridioides difficile TaxID=1496 RepID=UPI00202F23F3|nr:hypothetical protein [Clostridioides difficile]MCM0739741.1 hypothetical protein [Clostridioides difficile]HBF2930463.1 hypothetical protein [Clostridioides difficile]HBF2935847.1 hypothetical protein [Clostridioides difficile]HBZ0282642.1 hypothetical protein [Clostridioides difficile]